VNAQAVELILENMMVNGIDWDDVEHEQNFPVPFLLTEANVQVQVQGYQDIHGLVQKYCYFYAEQDEENLCGVYDLQVVDSSNFPLEVQQCHVLSCG